MISPLANIHPKVKLGKEVTISAFSTIEEDVIIGDRTWIGPNVTIMNGARIGNDCKIFPGAVISSIPQDLKFEGEKTTATIGDHTVIRECVTISRGTKDKFNTHIGSHCLLMAYVHVAHDCVIGDNVILVNAVQTAGHVVVDNYAIVGGASAIHQFVKIGAHCMISGGSLVRKDVPPYIKAGREPLAYAGVNTIGLRRRGFSSEQINEIQEVYRFLFLKNLNNSKATEAIEAELPETKERDLIVSFIKDSERGILKGYTK